MIVTLEIPDAKFKVGDVIRKQNSANPLNIFVLITQRIASGVWDVFDEGNENSVSVHPNYNGSGKVDDYYTCVVQENSFYDIVNPTEKDVIRPGTIFVYHREELDECGEKVDWNKPLISADTIDNLRERLS